MNRTARKAAALVALAASLLAATSAHAVQITFRVRMAYQVTIGSFHPGDDFVDLAGSFNGWGTNPLTPLSDADGDTIYEVTVGGFTPSQQIEYKFRLNGQWDGTEEFPGVGNNRFYTVPAANDTILVWYNDLAPGGGTGELHWWNDCVFYEIFVRSFYDSDGDGVGDFQGLTQKLDYLNDGDPNTDDDLGVTGIWLMPVCDSPSYHGYDGTDYRSINPDYGTMADFRAFLDAAHTRGIRVIVDFVMNHCSNQHPWFVAAGQENPLYRDFFRWSPTDPNQTGPWGQDVWHWHPSDWYYGLFTSGMPDLNYETPAVRDTMFQIAEYWLDTVGVDGFRLDAVLYILEEGNQLQNTPSTFAFWEDYTARVKSVNPEALSVGEAWTGTSTVLQYVAEGRLDMCFEFDLAYATLDAVNGADAAWLGTKAEQVYHLYPHLQYATFLTNHDQNRTFTTLGLSAGKAKAAAGLYLTLPGVPFVYYGEEIGMTGSGDHLNIRTPMQWTGGEDAGFTTGTPWRAVNSDYALRNVADEESDPASLLEWYKRLIHARGASPALRQGAHQALDASQAAVLAFVRVCEQETVLCVVNAGPSSLSGVTLTGSAASLEPGDHTLVSLLDPGDTLSVTVTPEHAIEGLALAGHEVAVYRFDGATGTDPGDDVGLRLEQSFPNPFTLPTTIRYALPARSRARLAVYDVAGREVAVLEDGLREQGPHEVVWDGEGNSGRPVAAGLYFVRLDAGGRTRTAKAMLVR
jgi:glycosidase